VKREERNKTFSMDRGFAMARGWAAKGIFGFKRRRLGRNFATSVHNCLSLADRWRGWQLIVLLVRRFWKLQFPIGWTKGKNSDIVLQSHPLDCLPVSVQSRMPEPWGVNWERVKP